MIVLIAFEWQKKMEHLKIIKPHGLSIMLSLSFRFRFWDMHEMLVATKRQKLGQMEDISHIIMRLFLSLVYLNLVLLDCNYYFWGRGLFLLGSQLQETCFSIEHVSASSQWFFLLLYFITILTIELLCPSILCSSPLLSTPYSQINYLTACPVGSCLFSQYSVVIFT